MKEMKKQLLEDVLQPEKKSNNRISTLTNREMEVMNLLVKGHTPSEIRDILNIRYSTISTYKERILKKMNVSNVIELANMMNLMS